MVGHGTREWSNLALRRRGGRGRFRRVVPWGLPDLERSGERRCCTRRRRADPGNADGHAREAVWNARQPGRRRFHGRGVPFGFPCALAASSWNSSPPAMDFAPPRGRSIGFPVGRCRAFLEPFKRSNLTLEGPTGNPMERLRGGVTRLPRPATLPRRLSSEARETGGNASPVKSTAAGQSSVPDGFARPASSVSWISSAQSSHGPCADRGPPERGRSRRPRGTAPASRASRSPRLPGARSSALLRRRNLRSHAHPGRLSLYTGINRCRRSGSSPSQSGFFAVESKIDVVLNSSTSPLSA